MSRTTWEAHFEQIIRREIPTLDIDRALELARIVATLVESFRPERIYVFGSQAHGDATNDSDVDLVVVVPESDEPGHRRDPAAYRAIRLHTYPVDILVFTRDGLEYRATHAGSLQTILHREGKLLHAA